MTPPTPQTIAALLEAARKAAHWFRSAKTCGEEGDQFLNEGAWDEVLAITSSLDAAIAAAENWERGEESSPLGLGDVLVIALIKSRLQSQYEKYSVPYFTALGDIKNLLAIVDRVASSSTLPAHTPRQAQCGGGGMREDLR